MGNRDKGIYEKFKVVRTDGSSRAGKKHEHCAYFVLDLQHDKHALAALRAYAKSCRAEYPQLAADLDAVTSSDDPNWELFAMVDGNRA